MKGFELSSRPICLVLVCEHPSARRTDLGIRKWISKDQGRVYGGASILRWALPSSEFDRALFVLGYVHVLRAGCWGIRSGLHNRTDRGAWCIALGECTLASSLSA